MVVDLPAIERLARSKAAENLGFRRYLKAHHAPEAAFHILAGEVARQVDCTLCANCCREMDVPVTASDVAAIAAHLRIAAAEVLRLYVTRDPDDSAAYLLLRRGDACVFLDGTLCLIYEARPQPCRAFPHLAAGARTLGARMASVWSRAGICPIVYNTIEEYKHLLGYRPRRQPPAV